MPRSHIPPRGCAVTLTQTRVIDPAPAIVDPGNQRGEHKINLDEGVIDKLPSRFTTRSKLCSSRRPCRRHRSSSNSRLATKHHKRPHLPMPHRSSPRSRPQRTEELLQLVAPDDHSDHLCRLASPLAQMMSRCWATAAPTCPETRCSPSLSFVEQRRPAVARRTDTQATGQLRSSRPSS